MCARGGRGPRRRREKQNALTGRALVRKYGSKLTDILAINANYVVGSAAALFAAGISGDAPPFAIAAVIILGLQSRFSHASCHRCQRQFAGHRVLHFASPR